MINTLIVFVDGIALGVIAMAFADARRNHRELDRAEQALAANQARLEAAHAKADAVLAKHREHQ